jgi:hypothetical protein
MESLLYQVIGQKTTPLNPNFGDWRLCSSYFSEKTNNVTPYGEAT